MDETASLEEIAHKLAAEFPKRFSSWQEALSYASVVSQEYSQKIALAVGAKRNEAGAISRKPVSGQCPDC
jgi:hypothetical protein